MFAIEWSARAFDQMDQIVRGNPARTEELAEALMEVAMRLRVNASTTGESRGGNRRVVLAGSLTVFYELNEPDRVKILQVRARFRA